MHLRKSSAANLASLAGILDAYVPFIDSTRAVVNPPPDRMILSISNLSETLIDDEIPESQLAISSIVWAETLPMVVTGMRSSVHPVSVNTSKNN